MLLIFSSLFDLLRLEKESLGSVDNLAFCFQLKAFSVVLEIVIVLIKLWKTRKCMFETCSNLYIVKLIV